MQRENLVEPDQVVGYETNHPPKGYLAEWQQWVVFGQNKRDGTTVRCQGTADVKKPSVMPDLYFGDVPRTDSIGV